MFNRSKQRSFRKKEYNYGRRSMIGGGYVVIPKDVERDKYIEHCYRTQMVFILTEGNEYIKNVKIDKASLREVEFPDTIDQLGSFIMWANYEKHNYPVIIGVYGKGDEMPEVSEQEFQFSKKFNRSKVEISGNAKERYLLLNTVSEEGSEIIIQAIDPNSASKFKVIIKGDVDIDASKTIKLRAIDQIEITLNEKKFLINESDGLSYIDEKENKFVINANGVSFETKAFGIGTDGQPFVLGTTLKTNVESEKTALSDLMQAIVDAPITPGDGGASMKAYLMGKILLINTKRGDYSKILSDTSKSI